VLKDILFCEAKGMERRKMNEREQRKQRKKENKILKLEF
jgi:hypothetical protein